MAPPTGNKKIITTKKRHALKCHTSNMGKELSNLRKSFLLKREVLAESPGKLIFNGKF